MSVCKVSSRGAGKPSLRATALARSLQNKKVRNNNSTQHLGEARWCSWWVSRGKGCVTNKTEWGTRVWPPAHGCTGRHGWCLWIVAVTVTLCSQLLASLTLPCCPSASKWDHKACIPWSVAAHHNPAGAAEPLALLVRTGTTFLPPQTYAKVTS